MVNKYYWTSRRTGANIGDYNGSQAREVLYSWEQWQELKAGQDGELVGVSADDDEEE